MKEQEKITFAEFKAFINGLIKGKKGALPDIEDWVAIKDMMDRVVPDVKEVQNPFAPQPYNPPMDYRPYYEPWKLEPDPAPYWTNPITCDGSDKKSMFVTDYSYSGTSTVSDETSAKVDVQSIMNAMDMITKISTEG